MNIIWFSFLTLSFFKSDAFNMTARFAEWDDEYRYGDPIRRIIKLYSRGRNITAVEDDSFISLQLDKREVDLDKTDTRQGVRIEADAYIRKTNSHASLGECTAGKHKYKGEEKYTSFNRVNYNYFHQSGRFRSRQFTDVMGGIGISAFGLFGASVKARVIHSVQRDSRSLLIYSHFVNHKGMISLVNPQVGTNWQDFKKQAKHYYLRDILTGLDDYLMVQLRFSSEAKRKEIEVTIKVKILFFSISKTIRRVKTSLKTDFSLTIYHIQTYPRRKEETYQYSGIGLKTGIDLVEKYEKRRAQLLRDIKTAKYNDRNLHLEYFFIPCLIKTIAGALPFTRVNSFILVELIERTNELKSVLEDIESNKVEINDARKSNLTVFEEEIKDRLNKIKQWKDRNELSHNYVITLLKIYGEDRAPYYYERQLRKILGDGI